MNAAQACPICRWPGPADLACERCDWKRIDGPDLETYLADRQRDYDLRAAARVASGIWPVDDWLLEGLADSVRGGIPPGQIGQLVTHAGRPPVSSPGMIFALRRLVSRKTDAVAFVEISPDAVSWCLLVADELGVPVRLDGEIHSWTAILQVLPINIGLRYLLMAGGVGVSAPVDPAALITEATDGITPLLTRCLAAAAEVAATYLVGLPGDPDHSGGDGNRARGGHGRLDTVLVCRTRDWPLLEAVTARAWAVIRPVTEVMAEPEAGSLADVVDAVAVHAPLRYGYDLILVETNKRTRVVRPQAHELFPPGAAVLPDIVPATTVDVSPVTGYATEHLALPIVARRGLIADLRDVRALDRRRPLVTMAGLDATTAGPFRLCVELAGPGRVHQITSPGSLPAGAVPGDWPGLMADLPERLRSADWLLPGDLDLVLLIELGAPRNEEDRVAARVRLAKRLIHELRNVPQASIGVLGYRDHGAGSYDREAIGVSGQEDKALVVGSTRLLGSRDELRRILDQPGWWRAGPVGHDFAAPVEDALWRLTGDTWGWRKDARHVVLIIGRRPPYPVRPRGGEVHPCGNRCSWRKALKLVRREHALECFAVLDDHPAPGYAADTWQALTAPRRLRLRADRHVAQMLLRDFGLRPRSGTQLRLAKLASAALEGAS